MYWSDECQIAQLVKQLTKNTVGLGSNQLHLMLVPIPGTDRWTEGGRNVKVRSVQIPTLDSSDRIPVWYVIISPISLHNISSCSFTSCSLLILSCKLKFGTGNIYVVRRSFLIASIVYQRGTDLQVKLYLDWLISFKTATRTFNWYTNYFP